MKKLTNNTLAFGNLKHRKKSYAVMIIGIILAMIFSSGIIFFTSCIFTSRDESKKINIGQQDIMIFNVCEDEINELKANDIIMDYAVYETIGYCYTNDKNKYMGASMAYMDENAREIYCPICIEGEYPQNKGEIAIEKTAMSKLGIDDAGVGDTVDFQVLIQDGGKYLDKSVKKSYKLSGIIGNKRSNNDDGAFGEADFYTSVPAVYVSTAQELEAGGKVRTDCLAFLNEHTDDWYDKLFQILEKYDTEGDVMNFTLTNLTMYSQVEGNVIISVSMGILLVSVLLIASCLGIVNAFSTNLNERKKQIGMLKTVGATQRQIIKIFGREAFFISLLCVPVSLLISYFAVKIISVFMEGTFIFKPNFLVLAGCGVFSMISVMLATLIPLVKASRISPVQSIRNIEFGRKMKTKKIATQKVYNPEKLLAKRSVTFNRGKQVIVCFFLVISIVGSGFGFSMLDVMNHNMYTAPFDYNVRSYGYTRDNIFNFADYSSGFTEDDVNTVYAMQNVEEVYPVNSCGAVLLKDELTDYDVINISYDGSIYDKDLNTNVDFSKNGRDEFYRVYADECYDEYLYVREKCGIDRETVPLSVNGYNAKVLEMLEPFVIEGEIDIDKIMSGEEVILRAPQTISFRLGDDGSYGVRDESITYDSSVTEDETTLLTADSPYKVGDQLELDVITAYDYDIEMQNGDYYMPSRFGQNKKTVTIGAIVGSFSYDMVPNLIEYVYTPNVKERSMVVYTSCSVVNQMYPDGQYGAINFKLAGEIDDKLDQEITSELQVIADRVNGDVFSQYERTNNDKRENRMILICMLSILILFLTISASVVNNSLSARIRASKKEIGTIRAVGASQKELIGSYVRQLLSMLGVGYISGFGIYTLLYIGYAVIQKIIHKSVNLKFTIWQSVVACIIIFIICSANLWMKIRKEMKNSIIENIREL